MPKGWLSAGLRVATDRRPRKARPLASGPWRKGGARSAHPPPTWVRFRSVPSLRVKNPLNVFNTIKNDFNTFYNELNTIENDFKHENEINIIFICII